MKLFKTFTLILILMSLAGYLTAGSVEGVEKKEKGSLININTAGLKELTGLPRIGEKVAQRIIDFRTKHGKFKKIEELMKVKGIGEKMFSKLKPKITI